MITINPDGSALCDIEEQILFEQWEAEQEELWREDLIFARCREGFFDD